MIIKFLIVFLLIISGTIVFADECTGKYTKSIDVCWYAKNLSNEASKQLPMQMDATMTWIKTFAFGNTYVMQLQFSYNEDYLKMVAAKSNLTGEQLKAKAIKSSKLSVCAGSDIKKLIKEGMIVRYSFIYNDMKPAFEYEISHCE